MSNFALGQHVLTDLGIRGIFRGWVDYPSEVRMVGGFKLRHAQVEVDDEDDAEGHCVVIREDRLTTPEEMVTVEESKEATMSNPNPSPSSIRTDSAKKGWETRRAKSAATPKPMTPEPAPAPVVVPTPERPAPALTTPVQQAVAAADRAVQSANHAVAKTKANRRPADEFVELTLDQAYAACSKACNVPEQELRERYAKLNVGMQKMNLCNRLRAAKVKGAA